jgi:ATP-binding cassette subfamily F protein uup
VAAAKAEKKRGLTPAEKTELAAIVEAIEAADAEVARLEARLADPKTYMDQSVDMRKLSATLESARKSAAKKMARWEELEAKRDLPS